MTIDEFLQQIKNSILATKEVPIPGYSVGKTLGYALQLPEKTKQQDLLSLQAQQSIDAEINNKELNKKYGIKPDYQDIQQLYDKKAKQELQFANEIQSMQGLGLSSIATSGLMLAVPTLANIINAPILRQVASEGLPKYKKQTLIENILGKLTGK
jgi:hypothetical protein